MTNAYEDGVKYAMVKLAIGARGLKRITDAVERMARSFLGSSGESAGATDRLRGLLAGSGTGHDWKRLASLIDDEKALKDGVFRLVPRPQYNYDNVDTLTSMLRDRRKWSPKSFSEFLEQERNRPMRATGWGPEGFVSDADLTSKRKQLVPPLWDPTERAIRSGNLDVARGKFLRNNPRSQYTRRPEQDLATVLHVPKGGMFLPRGGKRGGIPLENEINPANELEHIGAGRGAYLFRGGGINTKPDDHVFLSGNAAVAKYYGRGINGMQGLRNGMQLGNHGPMSGVPQAREETGLPTPNLLQWFKSTVARTPQGQPIPTRPHSQGKTGTKGMPYEEIKRMSAEPSSGTSMDSLMSYQLDIPTRNLGPKQSQVPRGFNHILGKGQVERFGLRPYENAVGWAYDTPQGTYVMRGREAFEKDFHTRDGRAFMRAAGQTPPRNQPLPLPMYDKSTELY